jgi:hypothetical protein
LAEIEQAFSEFDIFGLYDSKTKEIEDVCKRFLGTDKLAIMLTSA